MFEFLRLNSEIIKIVSEKLHYFIYQTYVIIVEFKLKQTYKFKLT